MVTSVSEESAASFIGNVLCISQGVTNYNKVLFGIGN
jgi:hypothetical protein